MSKFPRDEAGMLALAREMSDGFSANVEVYPAPPVTTDALDASLENCAAARDAVQAAKAALEEAITVKQARWKIICARTSATRRIRCISMMRS